MDSDIEIKDLVSIILSILALIVTIFFFFVNSPDNITPQTYIIFGILILLILVGGFVTYLTSKWKRMSNLVDNNKRDIEDIKKAFDFNKLYNDMNVRLNVVETMIRELFNKKGKRGQIDPRIIFWILLIILLILFLRSIGFLKF